MELVLPTVPHLAAQVREAVAGWTVTPRIVVEPAEKWAAFRTARAALAASGTVTLELALAGVPTVAAYRLIARRGHRRAASRLQARLSSVILANLVIGENIVPELLQRDCTPERLADGAACRCSPTPRSGGARSRPSGGSMPSWRIGGERRAPRPPPSSSTWRKTMAAAIRRRSAPRHRRVNR